MFKNIIYQAKAIMRFIKSALFSHGPVMQAVYLDRRFTDCINKDDIRLIFDLGTRDGLSAIDLSVYYGALVYAFECNPEAVEICKRNLKGSSNTKLIEKAVWNEDKKIKFYPVNRVKSREPNIGASSCLRLNFKERSRPQWQEEICVQDEILVEAVRLDTFCLSQGIKQIDMLCMDLEGVELEALEGCGRLLEEIKYIITEVSYESIRYGQRGLYKDIVPYLDNKGFTLKAEIRMEKGMTGDALFINRNIKPH